MFFSNLFYLFLSKEKILFSKKKKKKKKNDKLCPRTSSLVLVGNRIHVLANTRQFDLVLIIEMSCA